MGLCSFRARANASSLQSCHATPRVDSVMALLTVLATRANYNDVMLALRYIYVLALVIWLGGMIAVGLVAAPADLLRTRGPRSDWRARRSWRRLRRSPSALPRVDVCVGSRHADRAGHVGRARIATRGVSGTACDRRHDAGHRAVLRRVGERAHRAVAGSDRHARPVVAGQPIRAGPSSAGFMVCRRA